MDIQGGGGWVFVDEKTKNTNIQKRTNSRGGGEDGNVVRMETSKASVVDGGDRGEG